MAILTNGTASIEEFQYPLSGAAGPCGWQELLTRDAGSRNTTRSEQPRVGTVEDSPAEQAARAFEQGRREGIEEGRRAERSEQACEAEQIEEQRNRQVRLFCEQFAQERENILQSIEPEVVKLALRIAERIVLREVEIDPLILTGVVRSALGQLADKSKVRVCVPAADADLWGETLAHLPNLRSEPEVIADTQLRPGECRIECEYGVADLCIATQLKGIARSFLEERGAPEGSAGHNRTSARQAL